MFDSFGPEERGFLVALTAVGAEKAVIDQTLGTEALCAAWTALRDGEREQRVSILGDLMRGAVAPTFSTPIDPSWLIEAMAGEPTGLALAIAEGEPLLAEAAATLARQRGEASATAWPLDPEVRLELRRLVLASLIELERAPAGPLGSALCALDERARLMEIGRWGARTIGTSLAGAPVDLRARAMASAGAPWASEIAAASARHVDPHTRESARLLVARVASVRTPTPLHALRALGLLALASALAGEGPSSALAVAARLPVELGRALLAAC